METLNELASELEEALKNYWTWLPDAVRENNFAAYLEVLALREICDDILERRSRESRRRAMEPM